MRNTILTLNRNIEDKIVSSNEYSLANRILSISRFNSRFNFSFSFFLFLFVLFRENNNEGINLSWTTATIVEIFVFMRHNSIWINILFSRRNHFPVFFIRTFLFLRRWIISALPPAFLALLNWSMNKLILDSRVLIFIYAGNNGPLLEISSNLN